MRPCIRLRSLAAFTFNKTSVIRRKGNMVTVFDRFFSTSNDDPTDGTCVGNSAKSTGIVESITEDTELNSTHSKRIDRDLENTSSELGSKNSVFTNATLSGPDRKKKQKVMKLKPVDVVGDKMLNAVHNVSETLHKNDFSSQKRTMSDLISKLTEYERETFSAATESQMDEFLMKLSLSNGTEVNETEKPVPKAIETRYTKRALIALRRELFYQAKRDGYTAEKAQAIAKKAVTMASERISDRLTANTERLVTKKLEANAMEEETNEKERGFYEHAIRTAEKLLYPPMKMDFEKVKLGDESTIDPDLSIPNIFKSDHYKSLGIFDEKCIAGLKENSLKFWSEWDIQSARSAFLTFANFMVWNQSLGPRNGFEEMIELTKKGKMWPYPIDNEYLLGEEENVSFYEHIFLEKVIASYNLPKDGPIAHFMQLVCVGLSKNPFLTAQKKREHLKWYAEYFDKKRDEIARLHKQDQLASELSM